MDSFVSMNCNDLGEIVVHCGGYISNTWVFGLHLACIWLVLTFFLVVIFHVCFCSAVFRLQLKYCGVHFFTFSNLLLKLSGPPLNKLDVLCEFFGILQSYVLFHCKPKESMRCLSKSKRFQKSFWPG